MDLYLEDMMLGAPMLTYISLLHDSMVAHRQVPIMAFIVIWFVHVDYF